MIPPLKPGARLLQVHGPVIETERLLLREWRSSDIAQNTVMLSDQAPRASLRPMASRSRRRWADGAMPP